MANIYSMAHCASVPAWRQVCANWGESWGAKGTLAPVEAKGTLAPVEGLPTAANARRRRVRGSQLRVKTNYR